MLWGDNVPCDLEAAGALLSVESHPSGCLLNELVEGLEGLAYVFDCGLLFRAEVGDCEGEVIPGLEFTEALEYGREELGYRAEPLLV